MCKFVSVEGILDFDFRGNNLQSLGCIEIVKLLPGNEHNQGFFELKVLILERYQMTDEGVKHSIAAHTLSSNLHSTDEDVNEGVKHLTTASR